jgi:hypothetical protein
MVGWVVLSNTWVELTEESLRAHLDRIYPGEFLPPRQQGTFVVAGQMDDMQFLINSVIPGATGMFLLHAVPGPYTEFSSFAGHIADAALRDIAIAQQVWLGVERISGDNDDDAYRFIGKVLATLAPSDASVLVHPSRLVSYPFDAGMRQKLSLGDVL